MKKVSCEHCKYKWITRSGLDNVTCPNCKKKTSNKEINIQEDDGTGGSIKSD